jgi:hypothetical protein
MSICLRAIGLQESMLEAMATSALELQRHQQSKTGWDDDLDLVSRGITEERMPNLAPAPAHGARVEVQNEYTPRRASVQRLLLLRHATNRQILWFVLHCNAPSVIERSRLPNGESELRANEVQILGPGVSGQNEEGHREGWHFFGGDVLI